MKLNCLFYILLLMSCGKKDTPSPVNTDAFEKTPISFPITPGNIDEVSGIAESIVNEGKIWVVEDGGNPAELSLIDTNGAFIKQLKVENVTNRDWEDIAIAQGPENGKGFLYIADTGDNFIKDTVYAFYRFVEPSISINTITGFDKIAYKYPDGSHDSDGFFVDPDSKDIFIFSKSDLQSKIYKLPYPQSTNSTTVASYIGELPFTGVTSAAISPNGLEIIVKTYAAIYYWKRNLGESPEAVLGRAAISLGYQTEQQGEAVTFKLNNTGFYTLSERSLVNAVSLDLYKRK